MNIVLFYHNIKLKNEVTNHNSASSYIIMYLITAYVSSHYLAVKEFFLMEPEVLSPSL